MRRGPAAVWYAAPRRKASGPFPPNPKGSLEHVTVLKGRVRFTGGDDGEPRALKAGDTVSYRLHDEVVFENAGSGDVRLSLYLDTAQTR